MIHCVNHKVLDSRFVVLAPSTYKLVPEATGRSIYG